MAKRRGIATILDNTWATPLFFRAIEHGADISVQALSKYVGGHSDLLLGSITANADWYDRVQETVWQFGHAAAPDDAWLTSRGLRTLAVRLKRHEESALKVASWLAEQPQVARVLHPAFESCPGHDYWKRDFKGSAGLFAFALNGGTSEARDRLIDNLELFEIGYSWGGFESLAVPGEPPRSATNPDWGGPLVRLQIGLEDPEDLIADLGQTLANYA
jgi:cystathionine beta-lyase